MSQARCESCAMPIETGVYCQYCTDDKGQLQPFDERFARMVQWTMRQHPGTSETEAQQQTLTYMSRMPAWRDHPQVKAGLGK